MLDLIKTLGAGLLLGAVLVGPVLASPSDRLRVVDGDTLARGSVRLRLLDLDAPELGQRARCADERRRGEAARRYAVQLLRSAPPSAVVVVPSGRSDRYRRPLVRVTIAGQDFASAMITAGHARPWRGRSSNWCA